MSACSFPARCVIAGFSEPEAEPGSPEEACSCAFTQLLNLILKNENHSLKCQLCSPVWGLAPGKTLVESRTVLHHRHSGSGVLKCRLIRRLHIKHVCATPTCLRYLGKTGISSGERACSLFFARFSEDLASRAGVESTTRTQTEVKGQRLKVFPLVSHPSLVGSESGESVKKEPEAKSNQWSLVALLISDACYGWSMA